jgi:hypothetical protein
MTKVFDGATAAQRAAIKKCAECETVHKKVEEAVASTTEVHCENAECPHFYVRYKATQKFEEAKKNMQRFE